MSVLQASGLGAGFLAASLSFAGAPLAEPGPVHDVAGSNVLIPAQPVPLAADRSEAAPPARFVVLAHKASDPASQDEDQWWLDKPAAGPVQIIVSRAAQQARVYVDGKVVAASRVSSGMRGHQTPTGVFSILQKSRHHRSNIYSNAPMPFMQRLTWSGIALHASNHVPDYPASHGCVRLPNEFAGNLFRFTELGAHVIIADREVVPTEISHAALFQPVVEPLVASAGGEAATLGLIGEEPGRIVPFPSLDGPEGAHPSSLPSVAPASFTEEISIASLRLSRSDAEAEPVLPAVQKSSSPLRILITRRTGRELIMDVQRLLNELGYEAGEVDGWMGATTGGAIVRFQEAEGLQPTGAMSAELVRQLHRAAGKGEPLMGHIYVRQDFKPLFDAPLAIRQPEKALGTHLFTAMRLDEGSDTVPWTVVTLDDTPRESRFSFMEKIISDGMSMTAEAALDRIEVPAEIRSRISALLTAGSSLAITDNGISWETGRGTDFIVLTR